MEIRMNNLQICGAGSGIPVENIDTPDAVYSYKCRKVLEIACFAGWRCKFSQKFSEKDSKNLLIFSET
jgi:hypothetical protein